MQGLSAKTFQGGAGRGRQPTGLGPEAGPIAGIAQDRMADMGQMHPDLVGAAGLERTGQKAGDRFAVWPGEALQHLPMGYCRPPALAYRALIAGLRVTVERSVDGALRPAGRPPHDGEIAAFDPA